MIRLRRPPTALVVASGAAAWTRSRPWLAYPALAGTAGVLYLAGVGPFGAAPVFNLIGLSAVAAILLGARLHRPAALMPWLLFALGLVTFVVGDAIVYSEDDVSSALATFADALYLMVYPCLVGGILLLVRRRAPGRDRDGLIDSLVIAIGLGVLSWAFLMAPHARNDSLDLLTKLASIAYPLADVLLLAVTVRLAVGATRRERSLFLIVLSVFALLVTDSLYGWMLLHSPIEPSPMLDGGWILFYVLWGTAALHPSMRALSEMALGEAAPPGRHRLALLASATLIAPTVEAVQYLLDRPIDVPVMVASAVALFGLVAVRMAGLVRRHEQSEARFGSLVRNSSDVVTVLAPDTTIRYASPAAERILGYQPHELVGTKLAYLVHPDDRAELVAFVGRGVQHDGTHPVPMEFSIRRAEQTWIRVEALRTNLLHDPNVGGVVLNTRDISERKAFERQLQHLAFHDTVTDLANRALFRDRVEHALERQQRGALPLAVLFLDLDDFKTVNDSLGHAAGDALLREVGGRIRTCIRAADTAARLGGDEFALLLEDVEEATVADVADRIMHGLESPFALEGKEVFVRASMGIAFGDADLRGDRGAEELLRNADVAMYTAKENGKGRYQVFEPDMHMSVLRRLELKADLQRAVDNGEFVLHYQPIIRLETGEITGLEALVRWQHPERGTIAPDEFIALAEDTGLIVPIGSFVLERACRDAAALQAAFPHEPPLSMSVNLSARQLQRPAIVDDVRRVLGESGLDARSLVLEITETAVMRDLDASILRLHELKGLGVRLAIDDFGAGYSSLTSIRRFPVDILKVDRSFVEGVSEDGEVSALAGAIIELAAILELHPVAEGIERAEQLDCLVELGCEQGQGFLFAGPVPRDEVEALIARSRVSA
jgi:diguanylate cyclase (GGDEF)-like protein/PAS domain S-box-containing protein